MVGARAVDRLVALVESDAAPAARTAALRTLEAIADLRALDAALRAIRDADERVATAAIALARAFLRGPRGAFALDRLAEVAFDQARGLRLRLAAMESLTDLPASTLKPLWKALGKDPNPEIRAQVAARARGGPSPSRDPLEELAAAAEHGLADDPEALRQAIVDGGAAIALPLAHHLIERLREREASEPPGRRADWTRTRAAAHVALANRGSRLGVYDLRESLEAATAPLPVEFLAAVSRVGDASCLEAIATAHQRSSDDWWRRHLADAFHAIVTRERMTRRHPVMKKIQRRWGIPPARPAL